VGYRGAKPICHRAGRYSVDSLAYHSNSQAGGCLQLGFSHRARSERCGREGGWHPRMIHEPIRQANIFPVSLSICGSSLPATRDEFYRATTESGQTFGRSLDPHHQFVVRTTDLGDYIHITQLHGRGGLFYRSMCAIARW